MKLISFPLKITEHSNVKRSFIIQLSAAINVCHDSTIDVFGLSARSDESDVAISLYFIHFAKVMM